MAGVPRGAGHVQATRCMNATKTYNPKWRKATVINAQNYNCFRLWVQLESCLTIVTAYQYNCKEYAQNFKRETPHQDAAAWLAFHVVLDMFWPYRA